jgi:hypothetical protein
MRCKVPPELLPTNTPGTTPNSRNIPVMLNMAYSEAIIDSAYLGGKELDPDKPLPEDFFASIYLFKFSNLPYLPLGVQKHKGKMYFILMYTRML